MRKLTWSSMAIALLVVANTAHAGGRARVHVDKTPRQVAAGKVFELSFTVDPDAFSRLRAIEPVVTAVQGDQELAFPAVASGAKRRYTAKIALPRAGEWKIRVDSRFCHTVMAPLAIRAVGGEGGS